ncbi:AMP-dependent synthetase and ligase [Rhodopseudomonas palustris HaA2]|uniref:3-methylmercaptopropionyl-CoA ligase n=1 Tax=Rhodopseudomonas palustris (strain HaA2) TaxID=316058 RepID=Q2J193_RHOP2|nr:class I adenylate-forming enzyme family protein [Rhodopseudomonas palustris]ABD05767.1 AMP-dependent synthetase and ligase [Rhodopseudomonas palustris HaA2]
MKFWGDSGIGGALRRETHYGDRTMLCFAERPPTLAAMFDDLVTKFGDRPAIVDEDVTLSYRDLDGRVRSIAASLIGLGVAPGDRVALFLGNCWEFVACALACNRIGARLVPIGTRQRKAELDFLLTNSGAKVLVFEADLADQIPAQADVPTLTHRFAAHGDAAGARPFADLLAASPADAPVVAMHEDDTAVILYTSGTTGKPKGAELTHLSILHSAYAFARAHELTEHDRGLVAVPLSHVTGLVGVTYATLAAGGCVVLMRQSYKTPDFLALASREKITWSILVPAIYTLVAMAPEFDRHDLSAWRIGCFGGAPMPVPTIEMLSKRLPNLQLRNAYGATETTSPTTIMPQAHWRDHMDSVGQPIPYAQVRVVDADGNEVAPGQPGELLIAGPMVVPRYWQREDANAAEFIGGYWRSGDIGSIDAEGFVRVFDRKKDMINRGGFKIFSAEVENVICGLDGVLETAIVGTPDPVLGERVNAIVVTSEGAQLSEGDVAAYCAARMSDYKVPESIILRTEPLPRNANGKIQKTMLRETIAERAARHSAA